MSPRGPGTSTYRYEGLGCKVQDLGLGFRVLGLRFRVIGFQGLGFKV